MNFFLQNTKKDIIMSEKGEQHYRNNSICRLCEKEFFYKSLEIAVTQDANIEVHHRANVKQTLQRNKVILFQLSFNISVFMSVIHFSKS